VRDIIKHADRNHQLSETEKRERARRKIEVPKNSYIPGESEATLQSTLRRYAAVVEQRARDVGEQALREAIGEDRLDADRAEQARRRAYHDTHGSWPVEVPPRPLRERLADTHGMRRVDWRPLPDLKLAAPRAFQRPGSSRQKRRAARSAVSRTAATSSGSDDPAPPAEPPKPVAALTLTAANCFAATGYKPRSWKRALKRLDVPHGTLAGRTICRADDWVAAIDRVTGRKAPEPAQASAQPSEPWQERVVRELRAGASRGAR